MKVKTIKPEKESTDWVASARKNCKWGVTGVVVNRSDSHGLCFEVQHDDGTRAWYEQRELQPA